MAALLRMLILSLLLSSAASAQLVPSYLTDAQPEAFAWEIADTKDARGYRVFDVKLTSQEWQGRKWEHWLSVVVPDELSPERKAHSLLFIDGGSQTPEPPRRISRQVQMLGDYATRMGTTLALLRQVPNQPLFDGLREDALIAHTFVQYMRSGDPSWPALLPMARSAMSAMTAVQELARQECDLEVKHFFVTGASKRGWTTWLTAAFDPRVSAIAPMVIDTLNFPAQMEAQKEAFGTYSMQIRDYTDRKLPDRIAEPRAQEIIELVDPYSHRARITCPKMVVVGTNDPYWPIDAFRHYQDGLEGETHVHVMPNTGHAPGPTALRAIAAFFWLVANGEDRPRYAYDMRTEGSEGVIVVECEDLPLAVELWSASSKDRDFRNDAFDMVEVTGSEGRYEVRFPLPAEGFEARYLSLVFPCDLEGAESFSLCTPVKVFEPDPWF